jgi:predicted nucleic acid-binding Zn ribbon protein
VDYDDDEWPTVPCPYCRAEISEDSVQCPRCGEYISKEDSPREPKTAFWIVMMVLAILVSLVWAFGH